MAHHSFASTLQQQDIRIYDAIVNELQRQQNCVELIASENIVSKAVLEAQGSIMTNKYAEGYPGRRYYGGCDFVDIAEEIAINRAKRLFNADHVNVQPHSGSQANQAVFSALIQPHDTILGLALDSGGHLTHGSKVNQSGKWFNAISYNVKKDTGIIDYENVLELTLEHKPKLIIAGCSAYSRIIDFKKFREIADQVGAYLMVDMAHFAGLVAAGEYPSPMPYADVVTTTTHKTLRGPRGGMILSNNSDIYKKLDAAIFPGIQGGPLMHVIAAKAVAFGEALSEEYRNYIRMVVSNAQTLSEILESRGYDIVAGGTDTHLLMLDLTKNNITGKEAQAALQQSAITCNKNTIPFDTKSPFITSGIRIGTPACTTRGFGQKEFSIVGNIIADILDALSQDYDIETITQQSIGKIKELLKEFPVY